MREITLTIDGKEIKAQVSEESIQKLTEWPREGDRYCTVLSDRSLVNFTWVGDYFDRERMSVGNVYRTKQDAAEALRTLEWPQEGDEYWSLDCGCVSYYKWDGDEFDYKQLSIGNIYRTHQRRSRSRHPCTETHLSCSQA